MKTAQKTQTLHDLTKDLVRPASWCVVAINETYMWKDDIQKKAGKILGIYFVNLMEPTHLCSIDISYPATFLYNIIENVENFDEDELCELEMNDGGQDGSYFGEYTHFETVIPSYMPASWFEEAKQEGENWEESQIEYYRCNHVI